MDQPNRRNILHAGSVGGIALLGIAAPASGQDAADVKSTVQVHAKIDDSLKVLTGTQTAPEDGYFVGYMFTPSGGAGAIWGKIMRGSNEIWSAGCSVQWNSSTKVAYNSYAYPVQSGDTFVYNIERTGGCYGGIGFDRIGEHS